MTVLEVIQRSTEFLGRKGVESPRLQVELLLAEVLKMPRMKLYLNFDRVLADGELDALREMVRRRGEREPLQHIVGHAPFCGMEFLVNRDVLVPRPETELLVEEALKFLSTMSAPCTVLDFGTGSGCVAISMAVRAPEGTTVHALDVSEAALKVARENSVRFGAAERVLFHAGDGFAALPADVRFDLLVSNPPYISSDEIATLEPEVREFDPRGALDGGADGLDFYRLLADSGRTRMKPPGWLLVEFGEGQHAAITTIFQAAGWRVDRVLKDFTGRERILIAQAGEW